MPLALFPGIRYDAREPPPPGLNAGHIYANVMHEDYHEWEPPDVPLHRRPHGRVRAPRRQRWGAGGEAEEGNRDQVPPEEDFLPPLSTSVKVQIVHDTAKFTVTQVFENQSHGTKQGVYQFPLPFDATVTGFDCRIGPNKIVRGKVKAREDARYELDEARRQGRIGGLMEQQTAEIFTITLANIPSQTKMQAELSFMCLLKHRVEVDRQVFTLTVPTFIAPRYGDMPPGIRMPTRDSHSLSLDVDVLTAEDLVSVESETHLIRYTMGAGPRPCQTWDEFIAGHDNDAISLRAATVELEHRLASLDKDLVVTINTALSDNAEAPQACLETHPTLGNHQALMLTLPPEFMTAGVDSTNDSGEIIFLADRSGSMDDKIDSLKSAMMFFINGIPENRPFNIWCFGSQYTSLWPRSRRLDEASQQEAIAYVLNEFASDMGGTAILPALEEICNTMGNYPTTDVIILTDGQVWSAPETIGFVRSTRMISEGAARFFSLGIGDAVSHELVEGIAKAGGGYAEVITSASGGGWEDRVVAVLKAATTSHISILCLKLEWEEQDNLGPPSNFKQSPADVSSLSPFLRNRIFLLFDSGEQQPKLKRVALQIQSPSGNSINKTILPKRLCQPDTLIHKLAARALLGDLERGESWLGISREFGPDDPRIRAEAIDLGCKWSLVSKWTSIYAVEEETEAPNEGMVIEMEIPEAADELDNALLLRRGGRAVVQLRPQLPHPEAAAEESGSESGSSESSLGAQSPEQSVTGDDSDDDSDDDANNPDFNPNTGQDTDPGSGRESPSHGRANQPGERQATPDMPQGQSGVISRSNFLAGEGDVSSRQSGVIEALQLGEQPNDVMRHSHGWNPTPKPEYDRSSGAQVPPLQAFRRVPVSDHPLPSSVTGPSFRHRDKRRRSRSDGLSNGYRRKRRVPGTELPGGVHASFPPPVNTPAMAPSSVQQVISSTDSSVVSSHMLVPQVTSNAAPLGQVGRYNAAPSLGSSDIPRHSSLQTNTETGAVVGGGLISDISPSSFDFTQPSQPVYQPSETYLGHGSWDEHRWEDDEPANSVPSQSYDSLVFHNNLGVPEPSSFEYSSISEAASAPIFNPPASTSLVRDVRPVVKSPDELAAEQFIRQLVLVQLPDGRFSFSDDNSVKATLGLPFLCLVTSMRRKLNSFDPAVTIAIVTLLEEQFHGCQDLWVLMVRKASDYITGCNLGAVVEELQQEARQGVRSMGSVLKELKDGEVATEAVTELDRAPVF
ncbi:hypothetical protein FDECE_2966 [Fusarium decemcellulare]|nr:hypothetical protein FDECE_2966 [Fusarium decemcellulare]